MLRLTQRKPILQLVGPIGLVAITTIVGNTSISESWADEGVASAAQLQVLHVPADTVSATNQPSASEGLAGTLEILLKFTDSVELQYEASEDDKTGALARSRLPFEPVVPNSSQWVVELDATTDAEHWLTLLFGEGKITISILSISGVERTERFDWYGPGEFDTAALAYTDQDGFVNAVASFQYPDAMDSRPFEDNPATSQARLVFSKEDGRGRIATDRLSISSAELIQDPFSVFGRNPAEASYSCCMSNGACEYVEGGCPEGDRPIACPCNRY